MLLNTKLSSLSQKASQTFLKYYSLDFGPQHPYVSGILRLILDLYAKVTAKVDPHTDLLLHRGTEKLMEFKTIAQGLSYLTRVNSSYVLSAAAVTQSVGTESFYDKYPLYTGIAIGAFLVGGVLVLCYWNVVPAVTVPLLSFLGLYDKDSARDIDPSVQKHFADLAKAALKDEQMSINTVVNNVTQGVDTANSVQSSVNLQNNSLQSSTSSTQSNGLDFGNSSVDYLGSQPNATVPPGTNSMFDSTMASGPSFSTDVISAMPKEVAVDTTLSDATVAAFGVAADTLPTASTISSLTTGAVIAAASQVTNFMTGAFSTSTSSMSSQLANVSTTLANNNIDLLERGGNLLGSVTFGMTTRVPWTTNAPTGPIVSDLSLRTAHALENTTGVLTNPTNVVDTITRVASSSSEPQSNPAVHPSAVQPENIFESTQQVIDSAPLDDVTTSFYTYHHASNLNNGPVYDILGNEFPLYRFEGWLSVAEGIGDALERLISINNMSPAEVFPQLIHVAPAVLVLTTAWFNKDYVLYLKNKKLTGVLQEFSELIKQLCADVYEQFKYDIQPSSKTDSNEYLYLKVCIETLQKNISTVLYGYADAELPVQNSKLNEVLERVKKLVDAKLL